MNAKVVRAAFFLMLVLSGCCYTTSGKMPVVDGKLPAILNIGETTPANVLDRFGEPQVYREYQNRAVMMYEYHRNTFPLDVLSEGPYRIFLVFEDNALKKAEVQKTGPVVNYGGNFIINVNDSVAPSSL